MGSIDLNNSLAAHFSSFKAQIYSNQHLPPQSAGLSLDGACQPPTPSPQPMHLTRMGFLLI